jgi:superfamily II DNA helicase RecQ
MFAFQTNGFRGYTRHGCKQLALHAMDKLDIPAFLATRDGITAARTAASQSFFDRGIAAALGAAAFSQQAVDAIARAEPKPLAPPLSAVSFASPAALHASRPLSSFAAVTFPSAPSLPGFAMGAPSLAGPPFAAALVASSPASGGLESPLDMSDDSLQPLSKRVRLQELEDDASMAVDNILLARYGPEWDYLSDEQRRHCRLSAQCRNLLVILPTGGGKTLAIVGCAWAFPMQLSLLVLPLVALAQDMHVRLFEALHSKEGTVVRFDKSRAAEYRPAEHARNLRVLIVSVADLDTDELRRFLRGVSDHGKRLARIFVDEVHLYVFSECFRPEFKNVGLKLVSFGVPLICTTATAGPRFCGALGTHVIPLPDVILIRQQKQRTNIQYRVVHCQSPPGGAMLEFARVVVAGVMNDSIWGRGKMLIFARTYQLCLQLRSTLQEVLQNTTILVYNGSFSDAQRAHALDTFRAAGSRCIMLGTDGISCGLDLPNVTVVIHYGSLPRSIEAFLQGTGRAARPGSESPSVGLSLAFPVKEEMQASLLVLAPDSTEAKLAEELKLPSPLESAVIMQKYASLSNYCRRLWLAQQQDGENAGLDCDGLLRSLGPAGIDALRCDMCASPSHRTSQLAAVRAGDLDHLVDQLSERLSAAEAKFALKYCPKCSLFQSKLIPYLQQPICSHNSPAVVARDSCMCCGLHGHRLRDCNTIGEMSSSKVCFKCLRVHPCNHNCKAQHYTLFVATMVLQVLLSSSVRAVLWAKLAKQLPPSLVEAATAALAPNSPAATPGRRVPDVVPAVSPPVAAGATRGAGPTEVEMASSDYVDCLDAALEAAEASPITPAVAPPALVPVAAPVVSSVVHQENAARQLLRRTVRDEYCWAHIVVVFAAGIIV